MAFGLASADPVAAQLAASVGLDSDYRLRGYSLTNDDPAATVQVSYDHPSGFYVGATSLAEFGDYKRFLGLIGNAGFAKRLNEHVTIDGGILRSQVRAAVPHRLGWKYTEAYLGAFVGPVVARVHYSPDYRIDGLQTLYGELEAGFEPARNWRLSGHVGVLKYLRSTYLSQSGGEGDWRIGIARQWGRLEAHAALSGGGSARYARYAKSKRTAVTAGASYSF